MIKQMTKKNLVKTDISIVGEAPQHLYEINDVRISVVRYTNKKKSKNGCGCMMPYKFMWRNRTMYEVLPMCDGKMFCEKRFTLCQVNSIIKRLNKTKTKDEAIDVLSNTFRIRIIGMVM